MPRGQLSSLIQRQTHSCQRRQLRSLIPTAAYWKGNKVKLELALAKGKQSHDKRQASKDRDWQREKERTMRRHNRDA